MSFLNQTALTPAQVAANQVRALAQQQFMQLSQSGQRGYNLIWRNQQASPAEVLAALGTDAELVFQLALLNINTINEAATIAGTTPPTIPSVPSKYELSFASDGTAILADTPDSSSSSSSNES
jgi:hypothetical protein